MPNKKGANNYSKIQLSDENNIEIEDDYTANYLNEFFANIGRKDKPMRRTTDSPLSTPPDLGTHDRENLLSIHPVSKRETEALKGPNTQRSGQISQNIQK